MPNLKNLSFLFFLIALSSNVLFSQNFLKTSGRNIINQNGDTIVLRGMGLGGWMVQEGYMMAPGGISGTQFQIRDNITDLIEKPQDYISDLAVVGIYYFKDISIIKNELKIHLNQKLIF